MTSKQANEYNCRGRNLGDQELASVFVRAVFS